MACWLAVCMASVRARCSVLLAVAVITPTLCPPRNPALALARVARGCKHPRLVAAADVSPRPQRPQRAPVPCAAALRPSPRALGLRCTESSNILPEACLIAKQASGPVKAPPRPIVLVNPSHRQHPTRE